MLRKVLWTLIYGVFGAIASIGARTLASRLYRLATGEEPPARR